MWIETRKQLPEKDGYYLVQTVFGSTHVMIYSVEGGWNTSYKDDPMTLNPLYVVRWLDSPEPDGIPKEWEKEYWDSESADKEE